ncbi:phosphatases II [Nemania sp. FL0031]|nr:phosphatases II [Nemania sp. FL0031]
MDAMPLRMARPTSAYTRRPPSPPHISLPVITPMNQPIKVMPRLDKVDPAFLSDEELAIITQNRLVYVPHDLAGTWTYEYRHSAQPILDFIYLGPATVMRNRQWLQEQGITMILGVRDARHASLNLMNFDKVVQDLGIEAQYIDVSGYHELNGMFPSAIRLINNHMLHIYRDQAMGKSIAHTENGEGPINPANFRRGKVLVFCETGNERSATIVCAYTMAVFGLSAFEAMQLVSHKRFCASMDAEFKYALIAYEDILQAQRTVHRHELGSGCTASPKLAKRGIDETTDDDGDAGMTGMGQANGSDRERFIGRAKLQPFVDN